MNDVAALFSRDDTSTRLIKEKIEAINAYMKHRHLPPSLKMQIRDHFSYTWQRSSIWDEREILLELPSFLRSDVVLFNNSSVIEEVTLLADLPQNIIARLCLLFEPSQVSPSSKIIIEGEMGNDFFIVAAGALESSLRIPPVIADALDIEADLLFRGFGKGDFFAEYTLFTPMSAKHPYTIHAKGPCELLLMSHETFVGESTREPIVRERFRQLAEQQYRDTVRLFRDRRNLTGVERRPVDIVVASPDAPAPTVRETVNMRISAAYKSEGFRHAQRRKKAQLEDERRGYARANLKVAEETSGLKLSAISTRTVLQCKMWAKRNILKVAHDKAAEHHDLKQTVQRLDDQRKERRATNIRKTLGIAARTPMRVLPAKIKKANLALPSNLVEEGDESDDAGDAGSAAASAEPLSDCLALAEKLLAPSPRGETTPSPRGATIDAIGTPASPSGAALATSPAAENAAASSLKRRLRAGGDDDDDETSSCASSIISDDDNDGGSRQGRSHGREIRQLEAVLKHRLFRMEASIVEKLSKRLDESLAKSMLKMKDARGPRMRGY